VNTNTEANVILFIVDQLSAKWLEAARDEKICALPNLDWLRENGTTFTQTFTSNHPRRR
jgi:arylsulfatase A-like enzyme